MATYSSAYCPYKWTADADEEDIFVKFSSEKLEYQFLIVLELLKLQIKICLPNLVFYTLLPY